MKFDKNLSATAGGTRELRKFHAELARYVEQRMGPKCPCCRNPMVRPRKKNAAARERRDRASVAHNVAVARGGNPTVWVFACQGCNTDQDSLDFQSWGMVLDREGDTRAQSVLRLAGLVERWCEQTGTPLRIRRV